LILEASRDNVGAHPFPTYTLAELDRPSMLALRDALNDALIDIGALTAAAGDAA